MNMNRRDFAKTLLATGVAIPFLPGAQNKETPNLRLLEEKVIQRGFWYPNAIFSPGLIICSSRNRRAYQTIYSNDSGARWSVAGTLDSPHYIDPLGRGRYKQLRDGSVIGIMADNAIEEKVRKSQAYKPFIAQVRRAKSPMDLLEGGYVDDFCKAVVPEMTAARGDEDDEFLGVVDHGIVERIDGSLLISMYGVFRADNVPVPYRKQPCHEYRSWVCISNDSGNSWRYLSTIASPEETRLPPLAEGYCEPDLLQMDGGRLVSVMRSGGNPTEDGSTERYTPLYCAISNDGGVHWAPPKPIYKFGVMPRLLRMTNGVTVCASGRPGVFLLFSSDQGATWSEPHVITARHGRYGECPSGYNSVGEVAPDVLCVLYDDIDENSPSKEHLVKMRKYKMG